MASRAETTLSFTDYPGKISKQDNSIYEFDEIVFFSTSPKGEKSKRTYRKYVQLCEGTKEQAEIAEKNGKFIKMPIKKEYWDKDPALIHVYARIYTVTGSLKTGNLMTSNSKIVNKGKKKNSVLKQAISDAYGDYKTAELTKEISPDSPHLKSTKSNLAISNSIGKLTSTDEIKIPPMLPDSAKNTNEWILKTKYIHAQKKLDGVHVMAFWSKAENRLIMYSRRMIEYGEQEFSNELSKVCKAYPNIIFDMELYKHGESLQKLSGTSRNIKDIEIKVEGVEVWIFDLYLRQNPDASFNERYVKYISIAAELKALRLKLVHFLESIIIPPDLVGDDKINYINKIFNEAIKEQYEGLVLKDGDKSYVPGYNNKHTLNCIKMKPYMYFEAICIDWSNGEGKFSESLATWKMQITSKSQETVLHDNKGVKLNIGGIFNATPAVTDDQKKEWFNELNNNHALFMTKYYGRYATIKCFSITEAGLPFQPTWMTFRDDMEREINNSKKVIKYDEI